MRRLLPSLIAALLALLALLAPRPAVRAAQPTLLVFAHPSLDVASVHVSELRAIFLRQLHQLNGKRVIPLNYPSDDPIRLRFDEWILRMSSGEAGRFWVDARIRGLGLPPRTVTPRLLARTVAALTGAIAYAPPEQLKGAAVKVLRIEGLDRQ